MLLDRDQLIAAANRISAELESNDIELDDDRLHDLRVAESAINCAITQMDLIARNLASVACELTESGLFADSANVRRAVIDFSTMDEAESWAALRRITGGRA